MNAHEEVARKNTDKLILGRPLHLLVMHNMQVPHLHDFLFSFVHISEVINQLWKENDRGKISQGANCVKLQKTFLFSSVLLSISPKWFSVAAILGPLHLHCLPLFHLA